MSWRACGYRLHEYAGRTHSTGGMTLPESEQVFRRRVVNGIMFAGTLALADGRIGGEPLQHPVTRGGRLLKLLPLLHDARPHAKSQLADIPALLRSPGTAPAFTPAASKSLRDPLRGVEERLRLLAETDRAHWQTEAGRQGAMPTVGSPPRQEKGKS